MAFTVTALKGSIPPLVTPFRDGEVDLPAFQALLETVVAGGSHGVVVNGTTAEPTTLTLAERTDMVKCAVDKTAGRGAGGCRTRRHELQGHPATDPRGHGGRRRCAVGLDAILHQAACARYDSVF